MVIKEHLEGFMDIFQSVKLLSSCCSSLDLRFPMLLGIDQAVSSAKHPSRINWRNFSLKSLVKRLYN